MSENIYEDVYPVAKDDYEHAGQVSSKIKKQLKQMGLDAKVLRSVSIACYEAEINLIIHSDGGQVTFAVDDDGVVKLAFDDVGPGIPNLDLALTPGWSTASTKAREFGFGAGMGLVNMKRVASEFDITSSPEGTHLKMSFHE